MSTNSQATFCPDPEDFVDQLLTYDRLVVRVTLYNEGPMTLVFDIRGLGELAGDFSELGW